MNGSSEFEGRNMESTNLCAEAVRMLLCPGMRDENGAPLGPVDAFARLALQDHDSRNDLKPRWEAWAIYRDGRAALISDQRRDSRANMRRAQKQADEFVRNTAWRISQARARGVAPSANDAAFWRVVVVRA